MKKDIVELLKEMIEVQNSPLERMNFEKFINEYKGKWINYCEIIIDEFGMIYICKPSHQETLIKIYMDRFNCSREDVVQRTADYPFDVMTWLMKETKCVSVYFDLQYYFNNVNKIQKHTLEKLQESGLIKINLRETRL